MAGSPVVPEDEAEKPPRREGVMQESNTTTITDAVTSRPPVRMLSGDSCLVQLTGPDIGKRYPMDSSEPIVVGRESAPGLVLRETSVSRNHAQLQVVDGHVIVRDLESTNGTYVNDRLVTTATLQDGDIVQFGRVIFKFLSGNNIENAYHQEIYRLTTTDPMTQLYNRRFFMENFGREVARARRYDSVVSLLMVDLDHFKDVNDTYGHLAGDHVLKMVGRTIQRTLRMEDILSRYGGEEFTAILPDTHHMQAVEAAERVRRAVEKRAYTFDGFPIPVTVSLGVAQLREDDDVEGVSLIRRADERLMLAKTSGRNQVIASDTK